MTLTDQYFVDKYLHFQKEIFVEIRIQSNMWLNMCQNWKRVNNSCIENLGTESLDEF